MNGRGASVKFPAAQFEPRVILPEVEEMFWRIVAPEEQPIRQVCINFWNMQPLDMAPDLFGFNRDFKQRELHRALEQIEMQFGKRTVKTGTRLLLEKQAAHLVGDKLKCLFIPQREMEMKMDRVPQPILDLVHEDEWQPLENEAPAGPLSRPARQEPPPPGSDTACGCLYKKLWSGSAVFLTTLHGATPAYQGR